MKEPRYLLVSENWFGVSFAETPRAAAEEWIAESPGTVGSRVRVFEIQEPVAEFRVEPAMIVATGNSR